MAAPAAPGAEITKPVVAPLPSVHTTPAAPSSPALHVGPITAYAVELDGIKTGFFDRMVGIDTQPVSTVTGELFESSQPIYDWINASLAGTAAPKNGTFVGLALDQDRVECKASERSFTGAKVSAISFPALVNGGSRITISVTIDGTFAAPATLSPSRYGANFRPQRGWVISQYALSFDGASAPGGIDAFTAKPGQRTEITIHTGLTNRQLYDTWQSSGAHKQGVLAFESTTKDLSFRFSDVTVTQTTVEHLIGPHGEPYDRFKAVLSAGGVRVVK
jgi:hypothetical protein